MHKLSKYLWHAVGESQPFGQENLFSPKKTKMVFFNGKKSASPHFGKIWRPNCWHQVNFWSTPENFGVQRFKLAMCKVGGINIEAAVGRKKFVPNWNGNSQKNWIFLLLGLQLKNEER